MSTQRFAVEFDRRVVGIAVRVPGEFMFFASDDDFEHLDGEIFPRARAIARRLEKFSKRKGVTMRAPNEPRPGGFLSRQSCRLLKIALKENENARSGWPHRTVADVE